MNDLRFNLSINEGFFEEEPRKCKCERSMLMIFGRQAIIGMLVRVSPPFSGSKYCIDALEIGFALLAPRSSSHTLFPVSGWPMPAEIMLPRMPQPEHQGANSQQ